MFKLLKKLDFTSILIFLICLVLIVLQVKCDIQLPKYTGRIVGLIQEGAKISAIWQVGLKMLIVSVISVFSTILLGFLATLISNKLARNVRRDIFKKVSNFSAEEVNKFSVASLITRTSNDTEQVRSVLFMLIRSSISAPLLALVAIKEILNKNLTLTLVTAIAILIIFVLIILATIFVIPKFKTQQKLTDELNLFSRETLNGVRVIRAYNAEGIMEEKFENVNKKLRKTNLFVNITTSLLMPTMQLLISGLTLAIVWIGAYLTNSGTLLFEDITIFTQYSTQILVSFMTLSMMLVFIPRGFVSAKRINEVLESENLILEPEVASEKINDNVSLEFKNLSFKYPDADECLLENISFNVNTGETLAVIGSTGSGKSTLINLITRFYDATSGEVLINGENIKNYKLSTLYNKIGLVPQKANLFTGTIKENLLVGNPHASDEDIVKALKTSMSYDFVFNFEENINYKLLKGGKNLSGGQKQRLCIARALIKKPEIYIFDDSFSALDYKTDKTLRENLEKETQNSIKIIVAQRIGTILNADKIIVLNDGKIAGMGTHKQLLDSCEEYREIAFSQLKKEEL